MEKRRLGATEGMRGPDRTVLGVDARPAAFKNFLAYTLRRLEPELALTDADLVAIEQAIGPGEVHCSRYAEAQIAHLDGEA